MAKKNKAILLSMLIALVIIVAILLLIIFMPKESSPAKDNNSSGEKTYCKPEQKGAEFCYELYAPVCGWFNQNIKCIKYPCAQNFENNCFACANENVEYYTSGKCPE